MSSNYCSLKSTWFVSVNGIQYLHFAVSDKFITMLAFLLSESAFITQVISKFTFFHQHTTSIMHAGDFQILAFLPLMVLLKTIIPKLLYKIVVR